MTAPRKQAPKRRRNFHRRYRFHGHADFNVELSNQIAKDQIGLSTPELPAFRRTLDPQNGKEVHEKQRHNDTSPERI